jgi:hypothetical protein
MAESRFQPNSAEFAEFAESGIRRNPPESGSVAKKL